MLIKKRSYLWKFLLSTLILACLFVLWNHSKGSLREENFRDLTMALDRLSHSSKILVHNVYRDESTQNWEVEIMEINNPECISRIADFLKLCKLDPTPVRGIIKSKDAVELFPYRYGSRSVSLAIIAGSIVEVRKKNGEVVRFENYEEELNGVRGIITEFKGKAALVL